MDNRESRPARLRGLLTERVLGVDGAMGTRIQALGLTAEDSGGGAPPKTASKRGTPLSVPFLTVLVLLTVLLTLGCSDPDASETTSESGAPDSGTQTTLQSETADGPTPTATPEPVVLGDCQDGMRLQPGEGCRYTGGGSSRPKVLLSAGWDGTICREGGPIQRTMFGADVTVDNFRLCTSGFEVDDSFESDIVTRKNADGSWTFFESRLSAEVASSGSQDAQEPGPPTSTSMPVMRLTDNDDFDFEAAWSPDGRRIAFVSTRDGDQVIYVMDADGSNVTNLTGNDPPDFAPAWSPDGRRIAFASARDGDWDIYVTASDGSDLARGVDAARLTDNDSRDSGPAWSPDGRRIAFISDRDGVQDIYVMDADGSNVTRLTDNDDQEYDPAWSPDGRRIAFVSERDGVQNISVMDADGSNVTNLTGNDGKDFSPAWSPDGRRIAFESDRDGDWDIYVMDADGSNVTRLTNNDFNDGSPAWSSDGRRIAFESDRDGGFDIYVMNAGGEPTSTLTPAPTVAPTQPTATPTPIPANRPPRFTNEATFTVSEEERYPSIRLTAVDPDETDSVTGFAITGGADRAKFSIDRRNDLELDAGAGPFVGTDYENPTDADGDNVYEVIVTVTSGTGSRELSTAITITAEVTNAIEVPDRLNEPNVEFTTETSVRVTWTKPYSRDVNIIGYDVRYRRQNTATWNVWPHSGTTLSATLTGLTTNADYDVQVRARSPEGASEWSPSAWATAAIHEPPSSPGNVRWTQIGSSERIRISWGAAANATYYKLYACTSSVQQVACSLRQVASGIDATEYVYTVSGSSFVTTYVRFAVSACNGTGCSARVDAQ